MLLAHSHLIVHITEAALTRRAASSGRDCVRVNVDPAILRKGVKVKVIELFCNVPDAAEDDQVIIKYIGRVTTSFNWRLTIRCHLNPALVCDVVNPEVIKLLRAVILSSKHVHVSIVDGGRMTTARARDGLTMRDFDVLPSIGSEIVH